MEPSLQHKTDSVSRKGFWVGWAITVLVILFMAFDGIIHIMQIPAVVEGFKQLGYPPGSIMPLAIVQLVCVVLYAIPRTSVLGAIFLTGYLGGVVDANVRMGSPLFSGILLPVYIAVFLWGALCLRSKKLQDIFL